jgi:cell division protein FtsI (penicillin-binding protein 3)
VKRFPKFISFFAKPKAHAIQPGEFRLSRGKIVAYVIYGCFGLITGRAFMLHLFPSQKKSLHNIADHQYQREIELAPYRGAIYDRRGEAVAISIRRPSLAVNPRTFDPSQDQAIKLGQLLKIPAKKILKLSKKRSHFAWIKRHLEPNVADAAIALGVPGLILLREPARFYPAGSSAANLVGFTGIDNGGLSGLERQFERDLRGQAFKVIATKDAKGQFIFSEADDAAPEKTGNSVYLTIDRAIQEIADDELEKGLKKAKAKKGFAIVSDPYTGRILAVANYPTFDPNHLQKTPAWMTRNHAFLDVYEPGSVTKPFVIAAALESGKTSLEETHNCENGSLRIGRAIIHDTHPAESLTTADALIRSSNICTYKIASRLGREATYDALQKFGFGASQTNVGFPGQEYGRLSHWQHWKPIRFANVAFGHGFLISGLELVQAMGAIANGGRLMQATLVNRIVSSDGLIIGSSPPKMLGQAISPETARSLRGLLQRIVTDEHGTAAKAKTLFYTTAGKTGTAQKVEPGLKGYAKDKYLASFVGFAPVQDPHLVIYVVVDEPGEKPYYGGTWAAPIFAAIAERGLRYLNVAPDIDPAGAKVDRLRMVETDRRVKSAKKM